MSIALVSEYGKPGEMFWRRISINSDANTVVFEQCHIPNRFLSLWPEPEFTCTSADIRGTCWIGVRDVGPVLVIVTRHGRARIPQSATGFESIRAVIEEWSGASGGLSWYESSAGRVVLSLLAVIFAVIFGLVVILSDVLPSWAYVVLILSPLVLFLGVVMYSVAKAKPLW